MARCVPLCFLAYLVHFLWAASYSDLGGVDSIIGKLSEGLLCFAKHVISYVNISKTIEEFCENQISIVRISVFSFLIWFGGNKMRKIRRILSIIGIVCSLVIFIIIAIQTRKITSSLGKISFNTISSDLMFGIVGECIGEGIDQGRSYFQKSVDISECMFIRLARFEKGAGGVIYIYEGSYSLKIIYSVFYNCSCSSDGGAIFSYKSKNADLRMICANRCFALYYCFAYINSQKINNGEYLSISACSITKSNVTPIERYPICFLSGNQNANNVNSSMNTDNTCSGISFMQSLSFSCSHCTFSNNKAYLCNCIELDSADGIMAFANIVHNNSPSKNGVVFVTGNIKMNYCIFDMNENALFSLYSGSLELSHCFMNHFDTFSTSNEVLTSNNNSLEEKQTYQIQFFNSNVCYADNPIPKRTLMETMTQLPSPELTKMESNVGSMMKALYSVIGVIALIMIAVLFKAFICYAKPSDIESSSLVSKTHDREIILSDNIIEDSNPKMYMHDNLHINIDQK